MFENESVFTTPLQHTQSGRHLHGRALGLLVSLLIVLLSAGTDAGAFRADLNGSVLALVEHQGDLIAAGEFTDADGVEANYIARWDGTSWWALGTGMDATVRALVVMRDTLVAGGDFSSAGGISVEHLATWDGSNWRAFRGGGTNGPVHSLTQELGFILYAGGDFSMAGGVEAYSVAKWIVGNWQALGQGIEGTVRSLTTINNIPVAAGDIFKRGVGLEGQLLGFRQGDWASENASMVSVRDSTGAGGDEVAVHVVHAHAGALLMGGRFQRVWWQTPGFSVGRRSGTPNWVSMAVGVWNGEDRQLADVFALGDYAGEVVAGGSFDHADGTQAQNIAFWNGSHWEPLGAGVNGPVFCVLEYQGDLVVGGSFSEADQEPAKNIALWDGLRWNPLNTVVDVAVNDLRATAVLGSVQLQWSIHSEQLRDIAAVYLQRADGLQGEFQEHSRVEPVSRRMTFVDRAVAAGQLYRYRLLLTHEDAAPLWSSVLVVTAAKEQPRRTELISSFDPGQNEPVQIRYRLARGNLPVRLTLYDARGQRLRQLDAGDRAAGEHVVTWDRQDGSGAPVARGLYFVALQADGVRSTQKILLRH